MSEPASNNQNISGTSLLIIVFFIFLILKLTETGKVADWSWWWVTSPIWIPISMYIGIIIIGLLIALVTTMFKKD